MSICHKNHPVSLASLSKVAGYVKKEDDYYEFRQLIVSYIENNLEEYLIFIPEDDLNLPTNIEYSNEFIQQKKREYLNKYIQKAKNNKELAGYLEISIAGLLFNAKIRLYVKQY